MSTNKALTDLASALISGSIKVVDLTAPLGPETPILFYRRRSARIRRR